MFRSKTPEALAPELEAVLSCNPDSRKALVQNVAKNLPGLQATLRPGETVEMLTFGDDIGEIAVLTSMRVFSLKKGKVNEGPFDWHEIDEVKTGTIPRNGGTEMIWLMTESFRLDYKEDDYRRWSQVVKLTGRVPRDAQNILQCVTRLRGQN